MKRTTLGIISVILAAAMLLTVSSCTTKPTDAGSSDSKISGGTFGDDIFASDTGKSGEDSASSGADDESDGSDASDASTVPNSDGTSMTSSAGTSQGGTSSSTNSGTQPIENEDNIDLKGRNIKIGLTDWEGEKSFQTEMGRYLYTRILDIQKLYNCKITIVKIDDYNSVWAAITSGSPPVDMMFGGGPHFLATYFKSKMLQPLDGMDLDFNDKKFDPLVTTALTYQNKHYGLNSKPQGLDKIGLQWVMLYNKKIVKEDLYSIQAKGEWTWAKFKELATKYNKADHSVWGVADNQFQLYSALVSSNNADWISYSNGQYKFAAGSTNAMEALQFYKGLADAKILKITNDGETFTDNKDFRNGKIAFIVDYVLRLYTPSYYQGMSDDYGILYLPKGPKASSYISPNPWFNFLCIPVGVKNPKEVAAVMNAYLDPLIPAQDEEDAFTLQCESIARDQQSLDLLKSLPSKKVIAKFHYVGQFLQWGVWYTQLQKVLNGTLTPQNAIDENTTNYNNMIADQFN